MNPYTVLGLQVGATTHEVRAAFVNLARELHPDHNGENRAFEEKLKRVTEAYDLIKKGWKPSARKPTYAGALTLAEAYSGKRVRCGTRMYWIGPGVQTGHLLSYTDVDIEVTVETQHGAVRRVGDDLVQTFHITPRQARKGGFTVKYDHPNGITKSAEFPPGPLMEGWKYTISGDGMPIYGTKKYGSFKAEIKIVKPKWFGLVQRFCSGL